MERGKYIVVEGLDGTGKGEQTSRLAAKLGSLGIKATLVVEPGETEAGKQIRSIVKNADYELDGLTNILLFTADRRDLWKKRINPALRQGTWVIGDRNWFSTAAYQIYGQQTFDVATLKALTNKYVNSKYTKPDAAVVLALDEHARMQRLEKRGAVDEAPDAFETRENEFQKRVADGYIAVANLTGTPIVDAYGAPENIQMRIWEHIEPLLRG